jgi:hypothetical protein
MVHPAKSSPFSSGQMAQNYGGPMNLEDEFCDILKKARFGQGQGLAALAKPEQTDYRERPQMPCI